MNPGLVHAKDLTQTRVVQASLLGVLGPCIIMAASTHAPRPCVSSGCQSGLR